VAEEAKGQLERVLAPDPDGQSPAARGLLEEDDVVVLASVGDPTEVADPHVEEVSGGGGWHGALLGPAGVNGLARLLMLPATAVARYST
jgi:hypothetical protein